MSTLRKTSCRVKCSRYVKRLVAQNVPSRKMFCALTAGERLQNKEAVDGDLRGARSTLTALQFQLETVEDKLEVAEKKVQLCEDGVILERNKAEEAEREMLVSILRTSFRYHISLGETHSTFCKMLDTRSKE